MNKITILIILFLSTFNFAFSQRDFEVGSHISLAPTWFTSDDKEVDAEGGSLAFKIGLVFDYVINENFGITAKLNYGFGLGGQLKHEFGGDLLPKSDLTRELILLRDDFSAGTTIDYNLSTLEVPFGLKITSNSQKKLRVFGELPILGFSLITSSKANIKTHNQEFTKENVGKDVSNLLLNWGLGAGIMYELKDRSNLFFNLGYTQSFTDITRNKGKKNISSTETDKEDASIKLNQLIFRAGIIF